MRIADQLRLKVPGNKSVDAVVGIVQRNNLSNVELRLESRVRYLRGESFRENISTVYAVLDGYKAKIDVVTYPEDLKRLPGYDEQEAVIVENVIRNMVRIGQQFRDAGITPTIMGYETDVNGFTADFQRAIRASVPEFYNFLAKFRYQN
ncbi:hypothetical protein HYU22_05570 [Candidatus Woesearchaeota archaeon]|nr:hypothetical protein [Candidatus Woesearchaeota archaeon]